LTIFPLLPTSGVSTLHIYTGTGVAIATLAAFAVCGLSDPGIVTPGNVQAHLARYPYDGRMYVEDTVCETCLLPKPARSKHCRVTKR
jgi:palmitoyltransferase ZDHHC4